MTAYTEGVDYELDARRGRVFLLGGDIEDGEDIKVTHSQPAETYRQVTTQENDNPELWVEYRENARSGKDRDFIMPRCKIRPDGDFSLKDVDSHQQIPLQIDVLVPDNGAPAIQIVGPDATEPPDLDFVAGAGSIYIGELDDDGMPVDVRYMGDTESMALNLTTEDLEAWTGDDQVRQKAISVATSVDRAGSIVLNEVGEENTALMIFGEASDLAQSSETGEEEVFEDVKIGTYLNLGVTASNPAGALNVTDVTVEEDID